jgi:hypothetical protein
MKLTKITNQTLRKYDKTKVEIIYETLYNETLGLTGEVKDIGCGIFSVVGSWMGRKRAISAGQILTIKQIN